MQQHIYCWRNMALQIPVSLQKWCCASCAGLVGPREVPVGVTRCTLSNCLRGQSMKCSCSWVSGAGGSWPQTRRTCTWLWASVGSYVSYRSENTQDKDGVQEGIGSAEPGASRATAVGDGYGRARRAGSGPATPAVAMATRKPPGASPPPAAIAVLARLGRAGAARPRRSGPCSKEP